MTLKIMYVQYRIKAQFFHVRSSRFSKKKYIKCNTYVICVTMQSASGTSRHTLFCRAWYMDGVLITLLFQSLVLQILIYIKLAQQKKPPECVV